MTDYKGPTRWRWVLEDSQGNFLADHNVQLDASSREYRGFLEPGRYLHEQRPIRTPDEQLAQLGSWIGEHVFGGLRGRLSKVAVKPAQAVRMIVPEAAGDLLFRPFELACFADGKSFREAGIRFVYTLEGKDQRGEPEAVSGQSLRILAVFSLPVQTNPLNLRRERYGLQKLVKDLNQTSGRAVELRVIQYGATRFTLEEALQEEEGWDVIHLSGHGTEGALLLEDERGRNDQLDSVALGDLLEFAKARLKLLILDACYTGAGTHAAARRLVGLDDGPHRDLETAEQTGPAEAATRLPSLAQQLSRRLDCAALAMRFPVGDDFATDLSLSIYDKLLKKKLPLPAALNLAIDDTLKLLISRPHLSPATPILVGARAAELKLEAPPRGGKKFVLRTTGLGIAFPKEPERFVGRLQPMLRATQSLASESGKRAVLFHGMPGAGKTACALELAYRHEHARFEGYVWHQGPEEGTDITSSLSNLMLDIQRQLNAPDLGLTTSLDQPDQFREYVLPRFRDLLQENSLLLVLDNLENLLTPSDGWRIPLWGDVVRAMVEHDGPSRVILTSRRVPKGLGNHPKVLVEPIHALSFAESVLLSRELGHLRPLFEDETGRGLLRDTLRVAQGHPKLLDLANGLAADRAALGARVQAASADLADRSGVLDAFFAPAAAREGETRQTAEDFLHSLQGWTRGVASLLTPTADLLFTFLCRLEPEDRTRGVVETIWKHFLTRLGEGHAAAALAVAEPEQGLEKALAALEAAGLVEVERPADDRERRQAVEVELQGVPELAGLPPGELQVMIDDFLAGGTTYTIHPGVAETQRSSADEAVLAAADIELGDYHWAMVDRGRKAEAAGLAGGVAASARRASPYLLRQQRWEEASGLLEQLIRRDQSPDTVAFALPLLERIAEATTGTERELIDKAMLAKIFRRAGRSSEAELLIRGLVRLASVRGNFRTASATIGELLNTLRRTGRLEEALKAADEKAIYTRQAGLGPWTQLADQVQRLQVLNAMRHHDKVLSEVRSRLTEMDALPMESESEEAVEPWHVREGLLETGRNAALSTSNWGAGLDLNAGLGKSKEARGVGDLELAHCRINDYAPLRELGRFHEARALLVTCRDVFERERSIELLGVVYSNLANLEDTTGDQTAAVRFQALAMRYDYQAGDPRDCASSHGNLASYLERLGQTTAQVLAHRLAAASIWLQMQSGYLSTALDHLSAAELPSERPPFSEVVKTVESIEGVLFQALFHRLPRTFPDGDAALARIWELVAENRARPVQGPDLAQVLEHFEPFLQDLASAAKDETGRGELEAILAEIEANGWRLADPVHRIWTGERDAEALTAGLDAKDSTLIRRLLEILAPDSAG
jgi:tetratricopeptide (TPR) repeat protein